MMSNPTVQQLSRPRKTPRAVREERCAMLSHIQLFCNPMVCSLPGSSVHGIFWARMLQVAISSSRGSSRPRDRTLVSCVSCIGRQILLLLSHLDSHRRRDRRSNLHKARQPPCGKATNKAPSPHSESTHPPIQGLRQPYHQGAFSPGQ